MINEQKIPCPVCQDKIPFDPASLLQGVGFSCPTCSAVVTIAPESLDLSKSAMKAYQALKLSNGKNRRL